MRNMIDAILITQIATRQHPLRPEHTDALRKHWPRIHRIDIEPPLRDALDGFDEDYPWAEAGLAQRQQFEAVVQATREWPAAAMIYLGFAPIPLVFHLGTLLGQTARPHIFQHHHQHRDWSWPSNVLSPGLLAEIRKPDRVGAPGDVLIRVSGSYTVPPTTTTTILEVAPQVYDVALVRPDPDALNSSVDLWALGAQFKQALDAAVRDFPAAGLRHVAASVPVGAALVMGMQVNPTIHLPIQTWNFISSRRVRALSISGIPCVLLLGASPLGESPISTSEEVVEIQQILSKVTSRLKIVGRLHAEAVADLATMLRDFKPSALHIACHGTDTRELVLNSASGWSCSVEIGQLVRLLRAAPKLECVVLSACFSDKIAAELCQNISAVIGFEDPVDDAVARAFGRIFWMCLGSGQSVFDAYETARLELDYPPQVKIHLRPGVDARALVPIPK